MNRREDLLAVDNAYQVRDGIDDSEDAWPAALLRSPAFQRLPPANLQAFFRNLEEVFFEAGDVIFRQGDAGDYFYAIKAGQCAVTRKPSPTARDIRLATLKPSDMFGEDALISGKARSTTVSMDTDGQLLKLDKANFLRLISEPVITRVSAAEAMGIANRGGRWLDVRQQDSLDFGAPPGGLLAIPFFALRTALSTLDRYERYVVVCEDGKTSDAAVYLLLRFGFDAVALKGGLGTLPQNAPMAAVSRSPDGKKSAEAGGVSLAADKVQTDREQQLEAELSTLKALVLECRSRGEQLVSESESAYRAEMATIRNQASAEIAVLLTQLAEIRTENARLREGLGRRLDQVHRRCDPDAESPESPRSECVALRQNPSAAPRRSQTGTPGGWLRKCVSLFRGFSREKMP